MTITTTQPHNFAVGQVVAVSGVTIGGYNGTFTITSVTPTTFTYIDTNTGLASSGDGIVTGTSSGTQTAYLQPGASINQNVTFSDGYADITLYATQTTPAAYNNRGLTITLTPTNGGPLINNGQPIPESEGPSAGYSENQNAFVWDRTEAFYTGASNYTYTVTFTNTLTSGTVFFDNVAIQTVNGMFNETAAALPSILQNVTSQIQSSANLALEYGLYDVGYEGGFDFDQNLSGYLDLNGYKDMGQRGFSSSIANVGVYANLDSRTEQLAVQVLDAFFAAGGTVASVFESSSNINSWSVTGANYFDFNTPKFQAAVAVEQTAQKAVGGLAPGQSGTSAYWWLDPGQTYDGPLNSTYLVTHGTYEVTITFGGNSNAPAAQSDAVEILVDGQSIASVSVPVKTGGTIAVPVGTLAGGRYNVEVMNAAPSGNSALSVGKPGTPIYTLENTSPQTASATSEVSASPQTASTNPEFLARSVASDPTASVPATNSVLITGSEPSTASVATAYATTSDSNRLSVSTQSPDVTPTAPAYDSSSMAAPMNAMPGVGLEKASLPVTLSRGPLPVRKKLPFVERRDAPKRSKLTSPARLVGSSKRRGLASADNSKAI